MMMKIDRLFMRYGGIVVRTEIGTEFFLPRDLLEEHEDEIAELMGWEDPSDEEEESIPTLTGIDLDNVAGELTGGNVIRRLGEPDEDFRSRITKFMHDWPSLCATAKEDLTVPPMFNHFFMEKDSHETPTQTWAPAAQAGRDVIRDLEQIAREFFQAGWTEDVLIVPPSFERFFMGEDALSVTAAPDPPFPGRIIFDGREFETAADETLTQTWAPQARNCGTCSHWNMLHLMCKLPQNVGERKEKDVCSDWDNYKGGCEPEECDSCKGSCGADDATDDDMLDYNAWIRKIYQDMSVQTFLAMPLPDKAVWVQKKLHDISLRHMAVEGGQAADAKNRYRMHDFLIHYGCSNVQVEVDPSRSGVNLIYELPK